MDEMAAGLIVGLKYKIIWKRGRSFKDREMIATYLGSNVGANTVIFDTRPLSGTQSMPKGWIVSVELCADQDTPHRLS